MTGFLVFDIETIVDYDFFEATASDRIKEKVETEKDFFPPAIYHVPVAISCLYTNNKNITVENEKKYKFVSFVGKNREDSEFKVVNYFFEILDGLINFSESKRIGIMGRNNLYINYPVLVSHNGMGFDLPVLSLRALKYFDKLSDKAKNALREYLNNSDQWENNRPNYFTNKNSKFNIDTKSIWNYNLKSICALFGIEVKNTMEGSEVGELYKDFIDEKEGSSNNLNNIAIYCAEDVLALAKVLNKLIIAKGEKAIPLPETLEECNIIKL